MKFYAMDTCFYHAMGNYTWSTRCEMLKELGFDATYLSLFGKEEWDMLDFVSENEARYGIPVESIYATPECTDRKTWQHIVDRVIPANNGVAELELAVTAPTRKASEAEMKSTVIDGLHMILEAAASKNTRIRLYPHVGFWLSSTSQAMELVREIQNPLLGVMFCGFHWYAGDKQPIDKLLANAEDKLFGVNICGSKPGGMIYGYTIEPLDSGHMDNFLVVAQLKQHGYKGSVGLQGYGCGGDVYEYLARSIRAFKAIEKRLEEHPEWGKYNHHTTAHLSTFRGTA